MRIVLFAFSIVVLMPDSRLNAQIRVPIAPEPVLATAPGPAPYNAKAVATSPTSIAVSWDAVSGTRAYTVDRARTDDAACCVAHSGLITSPSWTDGTLEAGQEYAFVITALYADGRQGSTQVVAATPMPTLPAVRLPKDAELLTATETVLRYTPCGQRNSGGPGPAKITPETGTPAGARFQWTLVPGSGMNYVVDRAPEGTTSWTFVGSTCGGPSRIYVGPDYAEVRDFAGGVTANSRYVYRVTAVSSNGATGWLTYHFTAPCRYLQTPQTTVSGSTVTVKWDNGYNCGSIPPMSPETYSLTTSFGYTKELMSSLGFQDIIYGVPVGTHTITVVGNYRTGGTTRPGTATVTVAY